MADSAKNGKADKTANKTSKGTGFFKGVKAEFKKISWPDKDSLLKQSIAVGCISVVLGIVIAILDSLMIFGVGFLSSL